MLELWLDTYQVSRSFRKRGIVELELPVIQTDDQMLLAQQCIREQEILEYWSSGLEQPVAS